MFISSTVFRKNWAVQNMINLKLTDMFIEESLFEDNFASVVTHGIVLIKSSLEISSTKITFTSRLSEVLSKISKLDTGFFQLQMSSTLRLRSNSVIENLKAQKQSVLSALSQSNVYMSDNVIIRNNQAISGSGSTLYFDNTQTIEIRGSTLRDNPNNNILA